MKSDRSWIVHSGEEGQGLEGRREGERRSLRKRHGLQGPIDDAFMDSFLIVKPTGKADEREGRQVGRIAR